MSPPAASSHTETYTPELAPRFRALLEGEVLRLCALLAHETDAVNDAASPRVPDDFAEEAERMAEEAVDEGRAAIASRELRDVELSLRRIDEGTYGCCVDCGAAIDLRRLTALPATSHCTECQSKHERR